MNDNLGFDFDFPRFETKRIRRGAIDEAEGWMLAACVSVGSLEADAKKKGGWTQVRRGKGWWSLEYYLSLLTLDFYFFLFRIMKGIVAIYLSFIVDFVCVCVCVCVCVLLCGWVESR